MMKSLLTQSVIVKNTDDEISAAQSVIVANTDAAETAILNDYITVLNLEL